MTCKTVHLVFWADNGNREDCSVYDTWVVKGAKNNKEAIEYVRVNIMQMTDDERQEYEDCEEYLDAFATPLHVLK